jgi:hypothetical protein
MEKCHTEQDQYSNFNLPKPDHLSDAAYESVVRNMKAHRDRERKQVQYKNESLAKLDKEFAEHLNDFVGVELIARYVREHQTYRAEALTGAGDAALDILADQLGLLKVLRDKGVDFEKWWNVSQDYRERFSLISDSALPSSPIVGLRRGHQLFGPAPLGLFPPYTGPGFGHNDHWCGTGCADLRTFGLNSFTLYKNDGTGTIGSQIAVWGLGVNEADAHARGAYWDTNWCFWYTPSQTGLLWIGADMVSLSPGCSLQVSNNTSWPTPHNAQAQVSDQLRVRVYGGDFQNVLYDGFANLSDAGFNGDGDRPPSSPDPPLSNGMWGLTTNTVFQAGVPIVISIGTRQNLDVSSRHVGVNAVVDGKWFWKSLHVFQA